MTGGAAESNEKSQHIEERILANIEKTLNEINKTAF
jgi:hypothetical protein